MDSQTLVVTSPRAVTAAQAVGLALGTSRVVDLRHLPPEPIGGLLRVVALGGGSVIDAAKIAAMDAGASLTVVPTILSTDAPFSTVAAVRRGGTVEYVETGTPERVVLNEALLGRAPWAAHLSGLGDLFAVESAVHDWEARAPEAGLGIRAAARALVSTALQHEELWTSPTRAALDLVVELLRTKVALGLVAGHPSAEEGTEHYLAYRLETELRGQVWHGELLMACLPVCAALQRWRPDRVDAFRGFTDAVFGRHSTGVRFLPASTLRAVLADLPAYCRQHQLENTVLGDRPVSERCLDQAAAAWERGW